MREKHKRFGRNMLDRIQCRRSDVKRRNRGVVMTSTPGRIDGIARLMV